MNSPVWVDLCGVKAHNFLCDTHDNGKGFVDFEAADVINSQVCLLEGDREGEGGCDGKVDWVNASIGIR